MNDLDRNLLLDVQTLILDGLSVPSDLVSEIILNDSYNVRLLSIREVPTLNEAKLMGALKYACRSSRPQNTPRLQGLYIFGSKDVPQVVKSRRHVNKYPAGIAPIDTIPNYGMMSSGTQLGAYWNRRSENAIGETTLREGENWRPGSRIEFSKVVHNDWADIMIYCEGIISFDALPCKGPRHFASLPRDSPGPWYNLFGVSPMVLFPLLSPVPLHASTIKAAKTPFEGSTCQKKLIIRCMDCLKNRYCETCHKWWCEDCYEGPGSTNSSPVTEDEPGIIKFGVSKSCFFCGLNGAPTVVDERENYINSFSLVTQFNTNTGMISPDYVGLPMIIDRRLPIPTLHDD
ncbi:hypothetical protein SS1G_04150 [Sclerotinia sclerotiorum 1980 UF-70]|uniref:Uncharacterized protein n=1 Tax=Sclerotinia sclerotiorum (strain ATCC 18683 / 1980 / Ss-1) TaxID=665079 RepID=A7EFQ9_SCLS1|nr:hypothetical protein SS1G_04150 [Sclerotinia sclerotiorum 1980 UF-70]EDO01675.1 hypothetical protein SS1G_04150 [Sclerotinia sclerotiorum 1980 UF-70]